MAKHRRRFQQEVEQRILETRLAELEARLTERRIAVVRQVFLLILVFFAVALTLAMTLGLVHGAYIHLAPVSLGGG